MFKPLVIFLPKKAQNQDDDYDDDDDDDGNSDDGSHIRVHKNYKLKTTFEHEFHNFAQYETINP